METIRFYRKTPISVLKAHFACKTQIAKKICCQIITEETTFGDLKSEPNKRDLNYPGTHGYAPYDLLMFTMLYGNDDALQFYIQNRYPLFEQEGMHQLLMSVGKNFADTGYKRPNYPYSELQLYVLKNLFGEVKVDFKNPGYYWRKKDKKEGFWLELLQTRRIKNNSEHLKDELEEFQTAFGEAYQTALKECEYLPQTIEETANFILDGTKLKLNGLYFCLPDKRSTQIDRKMKTCKELFEMEFFRISPNQTTQDGMRRLFYHEFEISEQELKSVEDFLSNC